MYLTVEEASLAAVEAEFDDFSWDFQYDQTQLLEQMQITPACNALYAFARKYYKMHFVLFARTMIAVQRSRLVGSYC